jgi:DNA-directed RNA polymerase subunit E'/Rpb7
MLFIPIKFKTSIYLTPSELDSKYQDRIYDKLKSIYEGLCTKHGYIRPNSIEIVKKSNGTFVKEYFNGHIKFDLQCRADTCNPVQGSVVSAVIKNKNQLGILAETVIDLDDKKVPILDIIIPIKSAGIISQINLDNLQIGDTISVEVMGKKYQMKDKKISIIGRVISSAVKKEVEELTPLEEEEEVEKDLEDEVYEEEEEEDEEEETKKILLESEVTKEKQVDGGEEDELSSIDSSSEEEEEDLEDLDNESYVEEDINDFEDFD